MFVPTLAADPRHDLQQRWYALFTGFGLSVAQAKLLFADLSAYYTARPYHNLDHILNLLQLADRFADQVQDLPALRLAIWYHDIIYDPAAGNNEAQSAAYAQTALEGRVPATTLACAAALIEATTHRAPPADPDTRLLLDMDLVILAAPPDAYDRYRQAIRQEYAHIPDAAYRLGRQQVLQTFLARERIFLTDALAPLEAIARQNIRAELDDLRG